MTFRRDPARERRSFDSVCLGLRLSRRRSLLRRFFFGRLLLAGNLFCFGRLCFLFAEVFVAFLDFLCFREILLSLGRFCDFFTSFFALLLFFAFFLGFFALFGRRFFAFCADERDPVAHVHFSAFLDVDLFQDAVVGRFPFHRRLIGLDLGQHFAGSHLIADFLFPAHQSPFGHGVAQLRHLDFRHDGK